MKTALIQIETELGDKEENLNRCINGLHEAGASNADLAVLPELATSGYALGERHRELAEPIPGSTTEKYGRIAREHDMYVLSGIAEAGTTDGVIYNSAVLIDRSGEVVGVYRKTHLPLYVHSGDTLVEEKEIFTPGNSLPVFETDFGTLGILICQDGNYPELFRELALKGADIVAIVYNSPTEEMLTLRSRVAGYVNNIYVLLSNKTGTEPGEYVGDRLENESTTITYTGRSHVVNPEGEITNKLGRDEKGVLVTDLDMSAVPESRWDHKFLRDYRRDLYNEIA